ncbi:MAG: LysM peptidoglycan-binding domain-containing protein [Chloroflexota bacterium]|nr:LysM peptidoglycan-binding domain-containing protein [Chloroflexota bacterium]
MKIRPVFWLIPAAILLVGAAFFATGGFGLLRASAPESGASPVVEVAGSVAETVGTPLAMGAPREQIPTRAANVAATPTASLTAKPTALEETGPAEAAQLPVVANTATPGPTVAPDVATEFTSVRPGQVLGSIAARYGVAMNKIVEYSNIEDPDFLSLGQGLIVPHKTDRMTPDEVLLPDSELVFGPAYVDFDLEKFIEQQGGYLSQFSMSGLNGEEWGAADVIERVALRYSVGPRVLLSVMESRSGWVTDPAPEGLALDYPLGHYGGAPGLLSQLEWTANELNRGYYGWQDRGETAMRSKDGNIARGAPGLNPATVAVQRVLAADSDWNDLESELARFSDTYQRLFGDPMALDTGPVQPALDSQPQMQLPFSAAEWWYLTGGPHGGWGSGSGWSALDFVPHDAGIGNCFPADSWAVAVAPGVVARNDSGEILLDLDGDGDARTGWVLQYLHITDRVAEGDLLETGDRVGRPSCEGGAAESTHLHISRRYNGLWVAADGPVPFVMDGWQAWGDFEYDGGLLKAGEPAREACNCRDRLRNGLSW